MISEQFVNQKAKEDGNTQDYGQDVLGKDALKLENGRKATRVFIILGAVCSLASELILAVGTGAAAVFTLIGVAVFTAKKEDGSILEYKIGASFVLALIATFINTICFGLVFYYEPPVKERQVDFPEVAEPAAPNWQQRTDYNPRYAEQYEGGGGYNEKNQDGYNGDYQGDYQGQHPSYSGYPTLGYREDSQI
ncbi:DgyrCDS9749 [Dimorphilus gyrociliatus]|uniref:DgyrCDS9749 n=1 Tax=Dimorphilus gyrociliatus TaxID=2664684 RepID=A0A7I8VXV9_9ANNE|nr:DgyrCDS9749 [Dimorphilus gyrociliatus]